MNGQNGKRADARHSTATSSPKLRILLADAFDHTLDEPETLVKLYAILGRIRLVSSDAVLVAAEDVSDRIVKLYAEPNRQIDELFTTLHGGEAEVFKRFSDACRVELRKYSAY